ncbi:MAG: MlaD family protein [Magnetococcus sp. YQC-5]
MAAITRSWTDRDRRFKQTVSVFVLATMIIVMGILWAGHTSMSPFDSKYHLHMELTHAEGLKIETPVTLAGILVGKVSDMQLTADNKIRVTLWLLKKFMEKIRHDSIVTMVKPFVGNVTLDISLGSPSTPVLREEQVIPFKKGTDISDMLALIPAKLAHLDAILANINTLTLLLLNPNEPLQKTLTHADQTMDNLERLSKDAADLMNILHAATPGKVEALSQAAMQSVRQVEKMVSEMQSLLKSVQPMVGQVQSMLQATNRIATDVGKVTEQLGKVSPEIPVLVNQGHDVMRESEMLLQRLNHSVLFGVSRPDARDVKLLFTPRDIPMIQTTINVP